MLLKEYYKRPDATAESLNADGYFMTGDAGFLDEDGHLKIIDRAKDVGKRAERAAASAAVRRMGLRLVLPAALRAASASRGRPEGGGEAVGAGRVGEGVGVGSKCRGT
jgi:non-ribosomal peptide synthetase component E (peptide arylation enzyme)